MKFLLAITAAIMLAFSATGCQALKDRDARLQLATQYATAKLIEQSSSVTAVGVIDVVNRFREFVDADEEVTVIDLGMQLRSLVNYSALSPADKLLVDALILEVEHEFTVRLGTGVLSPEDRMAIHTFLNWVEMAALFYV